MYGGCAIQTPGKKHSLARRESLCGLLSVLPAVVMEIAACGYPIAMAFVKSFTNWDLSLIHICGRQAERK